jgi:hypothetical protein
MLQEFCQYNRNYLGRAPLNRKSRLFLPALDKEEEKRYYPNRPHDIKTLSTLLDDYPPITHRFTINSPMFPL